MTRVFTEDATVMLDELERDAERIDRKLVRSSFQHRPDGTGVRWRSNLRVTWTTDGILFAWECPAGRIGPDGKALSAADETRGARAEDHRRLLLDKLEDLGLEHRSAAYE